MLDIGFLPDIRRVLKHVPAARQTLMFSATLPSEIVTLSKEILRNPVSIEVGRTSTAPAGGITHAMYPVPAELKSALLVELLKRGEIKSVIAFTRTKHRANRLADYLVRARHRGRPHPRQPQPGAAHRRPGRAQERAHPRPGRHRHRGARDRRGGAFARGQLRRPELARGLRPSRRPHRAGGHEGRRVPLRRPRGGAERRAHRARDRQAHPARDRPRLRLPQQARGERSRSRSASAWPPCARSAAPGTRGATPDRRRRVRPAGIPRPAIGPLADRTDGRRAPDSVTAAEGRRARGADRGSQKACRREPAGVRAAGRLRPTRSSGPARPR